MNASHLQMPIEPDKDEGPATTISFLGLELDTMAMEVWLPAEKLKRLKALIASWRGRKACKKERFTLNDWPPHPRRQGG